jgi:uncharacterized membrane protein YphA (DoxX/SURF4 family)
LTSDANPSFNRLHHNSQHPAARFAAKGKGAMNSLAWIAQIILAACFLVTGAGKLFAYKRLLGVVEARLKARPAGVSPGLATFIGLAEIAGALAVLIPPAMLPPELAAGHLLVRIGAAGLALIMVLAGIYHLRRQEEAAPAVTLFLLAVFVIFERWPR